MPKRVHELAKELKISTSALKVHLTDLGIPFKNHMSTLSDEDVQKVRNKFHQQVESIKKKDESRKKIHEIISISRKQKKKEEYKKQHPEKKSEEAKEPKPKVVLKAEDSKEKTPSKTPSLVQIVKKKKPELIQLQRNKSKAKIKEAQEKAKEKREKEQAGKHSHKKRVIPEFKQAYSKSDKRIKKVKKPKIYEIKKEIDEKKKSLEPITSAPPSKKEIIREKKKKDYETKSKHLDAKRKHIKGKGSKKKIIFDFEESEIKRNINKVMSESKKKKKKKEEKHQQQEDVKITITENSTVADIAKVMDIPATEIIKKLFSMGMMVTLNQSLDKDTLELIFDEFNFEANFEEEYGKDILTTETAEENIPESELEERPPIVALMGHVDHGKTTILDKIRESDLAKKEAGNITQDIGGYQVKFNDKKITFIDTPGHEAFTAMRARGADITDIVIIVVSAVESVKAQTIEAIEHARAAGVEIIVAINKIDLKDANIDKTINDLLAQNLYLEGFGGDVPYVLVSGKTGEGIDELLETIILVAEMKEYKAPLNVPAEGVVLRSEKSPTKGIMTSIIIKKGILKKSDIVVCGKTYGRVRKILDDANKEVNELHPSDVGLIFGLNDVSMGGDKLNKIDNEKKAKEIATQRQRQKDEINRFQSTVTLGNLYRKISESNIKGLNLIVKGNTDGIVQAICDSLEKLSTDEVAVRIIRRAVGGITEADVELAYVSQSIILGFHVRVPNPVKREAEKKGIEIKVYQVIYNLIDDIKAALSGMLAPELKETVIGSAQVKKVFKIKGVGNIAGCFVESGKMIYPSKIRLYRDDKQIFEGDMLALKHYNEDAKEVLAGSECGISLVNFNDIKEGDVIECFTVEKVQRKL